MNPKIDHEQPVSKLYMQLAIPLVFSMVITLVYNLTDTFFCRSYSQYRFGIRCFPRCTRIYLFNGSR